MAKVSEFICWAVEVINRVLSMFSVFSSTHVIFYLHIFSCSSSFLKVFNHVNSESEPPLTGISFYFLCLPLPLNFCGVLPEPQCLVLHLLASTSLFHERPPYLPGLYRSRCRSLSLAECSTTHFP